MSNLQSILDVNGDGKINSRDAVAAGKIAAAAAAGVASTAFIGMVVGNAIVAAKAAAIAKTVAAIAGAGAGVAFGGILGTSTAVTITKGVTLINGGSMALISTTSTAVTSISSAVVAKTSALTTAGAWAAEASTGYIAGLPIIEKVAVAKEVKEGSVVIIGGKVIGVKAAIASGLIAAIVVAGVVYYVAIKPRKENNKG